jgi:hypothetical protein
VGPHIVEVIALYMGREVSINSSLQTSVTPPVSSYPVVIIKTLLSENYPIKKRRRKDERPDFGSRYAPEN